METVIKVIVILANAAMEFPAINTAIHLSPCIISVFDGVNPENYLCKNPTLICLRLVNWGKHGGTLSFTVCPEMAYVELK